MVTVITFLSWLSTIPYVYTLFHTCVPNTHFQLNGRVCYCDYSGRWSEANCNTIIQEDTCLPGQIIWEDCSQCICQENGRLACTNTACGDEFSSRGHPTNNVKKRGHGCTPFGSYYVDCHLCSCPASGLTTEARCVPDASCLAKGPDSSDFKVSLKSICIPNVMYIFPCLSCICSENGYFIISKCVDTCHRTRQTDVGCIPGIFYKSGCNVCKCPDSSVPDKTLCTKVDCKYAIETSLDILKNMTSLCTPRKFTEPKCFYCECGPKGTVDKRACYELGCIKDPSIRYDLEYRTCSPGAMVPICVECFCPYNGFTDERFCSKACSFKSKMVVLEELLRQSFDKQRATDIEVKENNENVCEPYSVFADNGSYCLCPESGDANAKKCTSIRHFSESQRNYAKKVMINYDVPCTPNTFVEFECNTCYCNKTGKIDSKWCTYDDCDAIKFVQEKHRAKETKTGTNKCAPGSISKKNCNFCICSQGGLFRERVCTRNKCPEDTSREIDEKLYCDPLEYYTVDCNVCYCPQDGVKNIEKCTKKVCEKNFLRTNLCEPGDLFGNDCNICVCPPNGDKNDGVCTNHTCSDADTPWKRIFKLSQDLLETNNEVEETKRSLDLCFPGEEFVAGCKVCVCPDMGLREFATCSHLLCDINHEHGTSDMEEFDQENRDAARKSNDNDNLCTTINVTEAVRKQCTPGSFYIIGCKKCICPYMGNVKMFCRPMPKNFYCEQAYPYKNYLAMGRRTDKVSDTLLPLNITSVPYFDNQTIHACDKTGYIMDECFICECEENIVVEEFCYQNEAITCLNAKPTFLTNDFVSNP